MTYPGQVDRFAVDMKNARQDRLMTQWDVANKLGVTAREVCEWEEWGIAPTHDQCARLAKLLDITAPGACAAPTNEWKLVKRRYR